MRDESGSERLGGVTKTAESEEMLRATLIKKGLSA